MVTPAYCNTLFWLCKWCMFCIVMQSKLCSITSLEEVNRSWEVAFVILSDLFVHSFLASYFSYFSFLFCKRSASLASFVTQLHSWPFQLSSLMWNIIGKPIQSAGFPTSYSNISNMRKGTVKGVIGYSCPTPRLEPALPRFHPDAAVSHILHSLETQKCYAHVNTSVCICEWLAEAAFLR